jgi:hypothetical protein
MRATRQEDKLKGTTRKAWTDGRHDKGREVLVQCWPCGEVQLRRVVVAGVVEEIRCRVCCGECEHLS